MPSERVQRQIDALLDEAETAINQSDWARVRDRTQNALALDPTNDDAQGYLAAADRALGRPPLSSGEVEGAKPAAAGLAPAAESPHPASFCDGRYRVVRFLGEGAKKRVYLAHDTRLDRDVAFALIRTDALDLEGYTRIRREAQAMGRLGDHPHIVAVFDIGEEDGQPYLVSQLMAGGSLEDLIERSEGHRLPLDQALDIADQVCQALDHAHRHGVVHRDLKPGNVWLMEAAPPPPSLARGEGLPSSSQPSAPTPQPLVAKLGDFGLALAVDRSRLTQAGMMVGTVHYMAPEQALGGEVTPRSDLYSLGAMLYEMVTGRPPFVGDESVAIITQHLNSPPVAPSWHNSEVTPGLEALILRLLEKDPARRPEAAAEVRQMLQSIPLPPQWERSGEGSPSQGDRTRRGAGMPSPPPSPAAAGEGVNPIYRRIFVGREGELRQLQAAFDRALSGQGGLLAVVGEPGIGKTALWEQLATYVAVRGGRTLVGHCYEEGSLSLPYLAFVEAMRAYVVARDPDGLRADLGTGAAEVARIVSEVRQKLALSPDPSPNLGGGAGVGVSVADEERWRLLQAVTGFLRTATSVQPLLIVLEDLHWADRGTLDLLVYLSRQLQGARLLVVGTYRDVEVDRTHPLSAALAELRRVSAFDRVLLRGLSAPEVQHMLEAITAQEVRWGFAEAVHRQTEGNPLFVQEVVRYLAEEGLIEHREGHWQRTGSAPLEMSIPEGLRDVIGRRLSRLSAECNRVLTLASVIGRDFNLQTLRTVADLPEESLVQALEEAVRVGVLEERERVGGAEYRFAHAFFRQTLYEEISVPRRLQLHQRVGRALESQYGGRLTEHAAELADHFAHSSDPADLRKAVEYGEMAAQRAMSVFAYGEAARLLAQALEVQEVLDPDDRATRCDLLLALGDALAPSGEPGRVIDETAPAAFALAEEIADSERAAHAAEQALDAQRRFAVGWVSRLPGRDEWIDRLDRHAASATARRVRADLAVAETLFRAMEWSGAQEMIDRALSTARSVGDPDALFRAAAFSMSVWKSPRQWPKALDLAHELRDRPRRGVSAHTLAEFFGPAWFSLMEAGERERADEVWKELESLAAHTQDAELLLRPLIRDGIASLLEGNLEDALAFARSLLVRAEELGSPMAGQNAFSVVAFRTLVYLGRADEALANLEGVGMQGSPFNLGQTLLCKAHIGPAARAQALLREALGRLNLTPEEDDTPIRTLAGLLEAAVVLEDRDAAALLAPKLVDVPAMWWPPTCISLHVARGFALIGDHEAAHTHYARALDWTTKVRHRPELALTRLGLAELLLEEAISDQQSAISTGPRQGKLTADQLKAEGLEHLDFAIGEFRAMKMQPALERALRRKGLLTA